MISLSYCIGSVTKLECVNNIRKRSIDLLYIAIQQMALMYYKVLGNVLRIDPYTCLLFSYSLV
jgi:hypothetical protein